MKKEPFLIFIVGMCLGYISQLIFDRVGIVLGILGYVITIMVVLGMTFNDKNDE
jgi:hypothetical protein